VEGGPLALLHAVYVEGFDGAAVREDEADVRDEEHEGEEREQARESHDSDLLPIDVEGNVTARNRVGYNECEKYPESEKRAPGEEVDEELVVKCADALSYPRTMVVILQHALKI